jgi:hypothetical protein
MRNIRTIAVFTDGIVVCAVGVDGVWLVNRALLPQLGGLGSLLLALIRPAQRLVRSRRQLAIKKQGMHLGPGGTSAAFARTRRKALAIRFADVTQIALTTSSEGRLLMVRTAPTGDSNGKLYSYLNNLPADQVRDILGPLIGSRLTVPALGSSPAAD